MTNKTDDLTDEILGNMAASLLKIETRQKVLLDILADKKIINVDELQDKTEQQQANNLKDFTKDLLNIDDLEYEELMENNESFKKYLKQ